VSRQTIAWVSAFVSVVAFGALVASGAAGGAVGFLAILAFLMLGAIGWAMRTTRDASWLPTWVVIGFCREARRHVRQALHGCGPVRRRRLLPVFPGGHGTGC